MVKDSNRVDEVEGAAGLRALEWRPVDVALHDMHVWRFPDVCVRGFDRRAEVHRDDISSTVARGIVGVTADPATGVKDDLVFEEAGFDRVNPIQELRLVKVMHLDELLPLPSERPGGALFERRQTWRDHTRDAAQDLVNASAPLTYQLASGDLIRSPWIHLGATKLDGGEASGTSQEVDDPRLHPALRAIHRSEAPTGMSMRRSIGISASNIRRKIPFDHSG